MRVLHTYKAFRPDVDGGVISVISAACKITKLSNRILVARGNAGIGCTYDDNGTPVRAIGSLGNIWSMPVAPLFPIALMAEARTTDLIAMHLPFPLNDIATLGIPNHVPLVVHWHSEIIGRPNLVRAMEPLLAQTLKRADRIIISNEAAAETSRLLSPHRAKCEIIPFGIDSNDWNKLDPELVDRASHLRKRYPRLIVTLGRLVSYKGFDVLIRALAQLDCHLILIGKGPQEISLTNLAADLGVDKKVSFAGNLSHDDVTVHLRAARVLAFPSINNAETFGFSQLEAMAAGLPIVNTSLTTGVPKIARHGIEALTVPPGDVTALSAALSSLLDDEALAARLGMAGQERVRNEFDQQQFLTRLRDVYCDVYEAKKANRPPTKNTPSL